MEIVVASILYNSILYVNYSNTAYTMKQADRQAGVCTEHGLECEADLPPELLYFSLVIAQQLGHKHARICSRGHLGQDARQHLYLVGILLQQGLCHAHRCGVVVGVVVVVNTKVISY